MAKVYLWQERSVKAEIEKARDELTQRFLIRLEDTRGWDEKIRAFKIAEPPTFENIVGVGIGEKYTYNRPTGELSLKVYVVEKLPEFRLEKVTIIPKDFAGFAVDVEPVGKMVLRRNTLYLRPTPGGISVSRTDQIAAGTFGCLVRSKTNSQIYILSNNHVLANENKGNKGKDEILQPGRLDGGRPGDIIGLLHDFHHVEADGKYPNKVDAAIVKPSSDTDVKSEILGIGIPMGITRSIRYMLVKKSGRTTQVTQGVITDIDAAMMIEFDGGKALFTDQILIHGVGRQPTAFSRPGDSGSAILEASTNFVCGLLFAGSEEYDVTLANKMESVIGELNVEVVSQ